MNAQQAKQIKITDYLAEKGINPVKVKDGDFWYLSPFRDEKNASFKVNSRLNAWYDHGIGKGGNIIDLVMEMHGLTAVSQALKHFSKNPPDKRTDSFSFQQQDISSESSVIIQKITPVSNPALIEYIRKRGIDIETARNYCKDIYYTVNGKNYFSVGFRNDCGGYELSNPYFKNTFSPKGITTFDNGNENILVFEGFWDFLSYLKLKDTKRLVHDAVVLNSVANLSKAVGFILKHEKVFAFLDNDEAGKNAVRKLRPICKNLSDQSSFYRTIKT